ncbi:DNA-binding protein [Halobellus rubicundus]|uniref:DNA-binding protein n=1 Tax=Halobellus rubicundus TaxID=2996466 RepID=A0ABD5MEH8_9EURY
MSARDSGGRTAGDDGRSDGADAEASADPAFDCGDCGRAFHTEDLLVLHRGVRHPNALDAADQEAYREAYAAEEREIRSFRLRALAVLVLLYFGFLFLYVIYAS